MHNKGVSCQFLLTAWISIILATNLRSTFGADISQFYAFGRLTIILPIKISANYQELARESRHKSILVQEAIEVYLQEQNYRLYLFSTKPSLFTINYFYYQPTYIITTISHYYESNKFGQVKKNRSGTYYSGTSLI
jgi:hypothetical protein